MPFGNEAVTRQFRNQNVAMKSIASDIGSATATGGAATLNKTMGKVTTNASSAASDATYTLTITNSEVSAEDMAFVSFTLASGTATNVSVKDVLCGNGTLTIVLQNPHDATAWSSAIFIVSFMIVKAISGVSENT